MNVALAEYTPGVLGSDPPVVVSENVDVASAARLMRDHGVQSLVVVEGASGSHHRVIGIVSGYDIAVTVVAYERDPRTVLVVDVMRPAQVNDHSVNRTSK